MRAGGFTILAILLIVLIVAISAFVGVFNRLQTLDENINNKWAQVENQLQRRNDLIPNLVETVKGYASHESEVFKNIADARSKLSGAMSTGDVKGVEAGNAQLTSALSRLLGIIENYPNLKADKAFLSLQDELAGTENRISVARMDYNEEVKVLNAEIRRFPTNIVANIAHVRGRDYFEAPEDVKAVPKVDFQKQ